MTEVLGWLQIVASPLFIGLGIGAFVYFLNPTFTTRLIAISIGFIGLIIGIIWATKIWKTKGTINFIASIMSTPEQDKHLDDSNKNNQ